MDTPEICDILVEKHGNVPQDIPLAAWRTYMGPHQAEFYHAYYQHESAPTHVEDGGELALHAMIAAEKCVKIRDRQNRVDILINAIFGEHPKQSDEPPSS